MNELKKEKKNGNKTEPFPELVLKIINWFLEKRSVDPTPPFLVVMYEDPYTGILKDEISLGFEAMYIVVREFLEKGVYPQDYIPSWEKFTDLLSASEFFKVGVQLTSFGYDKRDLKCIYIDLKKAEEKGMNVNGIRKFMKRLRNKEG